jgi:hypothetical protein
MVPVTTKQSSIHQWQLIQSLMAQGLCGSEMCLKMVNHGHHTSKNMAMAMIGCKDDHLTR